MLLPTEAAFFSLHSVFTLWSFSFNKSIICFYIEKEREGNVLLYPLKLIPPLKDYLWGGTKLKEKFHKETSLPTVAESWELACRKDGRSVIENGPSAGM